jgi:spermidine synthase
MVNPKENPTPNRLEQNMIGVRWVTLIYFFSGVCSLIDEVIWVRLLKLTLGNTVYASSIVVSTFMAGLALGAWVMGRYADRIKKRLRLYALLELGVTVSALSIPIFLHWADGLYRWIYVHSHPALWALVVVQTLISAILLLIPTMLMGSTLPLVGRYVTALQARVGRLVGGLYALNTLGAAVGCFLAGFVLIRAAGVMGTLYIAAGINFFIAIGGWILSRHYDDSSETLDEKNSPAKHKSKEKTFHLVQSIMVIAFFSSGLISIGYELIWMRSIVILLGGATYVFSAVLTIYLLGNVFGAWMGSLLSKRLRLPEAGFGISLTLLGILGIFYVNYLDLWVSKLAIPMIHFLSGSQAVTQFQDTLFPIIHSLILFFLPSVIMGIGFPLALQMWSTHRHKVGETTSIVYSVNTMGAVIGGLITGFVLVPVFGVQCSIIVLGVLGVVLGSVMIQLSYKKMLPLFRISHAIIIVGITVLLLFIPPDLFRKQFIQRGWSKKQLVAVKEGVTTTVSIHRGEDNDLTMALSGVQVAGDSRGFRVTQKTLGHLGILLNQHVERIMSVGFGSGESSSCLALHQMDAIDIVEISPEVVEMSLKYFRHIHAGNEFEKKVNIIYMDAKNYIHLTDAQYDLILTDAINPKQVAENASLYTKEYFASVLNHLNPGGLCGCWLPITEMPVSCTNSTIGTFAEVFPYVTVWFTSTFFSTYDFIYLVGSREKQKYSPKYMENILSDKSIAGSADYINFNTPHDVLSCYIGDQEGLKQYLRTYSVNSDYQPFIEFNTDQKETMSDKKQWFADFINKVRGGGVLDYLDWTGFSTDEKDTWRQEYQKYQDVTTLLLRSRVEPDPIRILQNCYEGSKWMPASAALFDLRKHSLSWIYQAINNNAINTDEAILNMDQFLQVHSDFFDGWLVKSWIYQKKRELPEALSAAQKAVQYAPQDAECHDNLGVVFMLSKKTEQAIEQFNTAVRFESEETRFLRNLGTALFVNKQFEKSFETFSKLLKIDSNHEEALLFLGDIYLQTGHQSQARQMYQQVLRINPNNTKAIRKIGMMKVR